MVYQAYSTYIVQHKLENIPSSFKTLKTECPELYFSICDFLRKKFPLFEEPNWDQLNSAFSKYSKYLFYLQNLKTAFQDLKLGNYKAYLEGILHAYEMSLWFSQEFRVQVGPSLSLNMIKLLSDCYFSLLDNSLADISSEMLCFSPYLSLVGKLNLGKTPEFKLVLKLVRELQKKLAEKSSHFVHLISFIFAKYSGIPSLKDSTKTLALQKQLDLFLSDIDNSNRIRIQNGEIHFCDIEEVLCYHSAVTKKYEIIWVNM